jgi:hypothetical protein
MFKRSGWNIVRSALLAKGGTLKKETVTAPPQRKFHDWQCV